MADILKREECKIIASLVKSEMGVFRRLLEQAIPRIDKHIEISIFIILELSFITVTVFFFYLTRRDNDIKLI